MTLKTIAPTLFLAVAKILSTEGFVATVSSGVKGGMTTPLHAVAQPPVPAPAEHQREEGDTPEVHVKSLSSEWEKTNGGFIPRIFKKEEKRGRTRLVPDIKHVETITEYKAVVADEEERIVVVRFFAPWCRACRAAAPLFRKMAGDFSPGVKFVEVPLTKENAYLHEGLGVPSVPFAHIYHPDSGLVEEMKMNKRDIPGVQKVLGDYVAGRCEVPSFSMLDEDEIIGEFQ